MITTHTRLICILLLVMGIFSAPRAVAIDITSVDPPDAPQDTTGLEVHIYGNEFTNKAEVAFYLDGGPAPGITVNSSRTTGSNEIIANIDIAADASEADYTLQVSQQRRGGKGTTYATATFKVTGKPKDTVECGGVDGVFKEVDVSDCDCEFVKKDEGGQGTPSAWIWVLQGSCETHTTLKLPQYEVLNGNGHTLTAVEPFYGPSVLTNAGHRTHVFSLNIAVDAGVTTSCPSDGTYLSSAISFVLDVSKEHPKESTDKDGRFYKLTRLRAWGINVDSAVPLCKAIEFRRDPTYDPKLQEAGLDPSEYTDAVVLVSDVTVSSGSYSEAGIQVSGFVNSGQSKRNVDKIGVSDNAVMGGDGTGGSAILFGPVDGPGTVSQNAISANGIGEFGIRVAGGYGTDDVRIENNNVVGAQTAIQVDSGVKDAYFKSNVLVGDGRGGGSYDIGIDTDAATNNYRSNRINEFDCEVREGGSCILP